MKFEEAMTAFEQECLSLGQSQRYIQTTRTYIRKLHRAFQESLNERQRYGQQVRQIDRAVMTRFFLDVQNSGGQGQANRATTAARKFLEFLESEGELIPGTSAAMLKGRKYKNAPRKPKHYIEVQDFPAMLNFADKRHAADRAALAVCLYTLCRMGELSSIQLKDVDLVKGTIRIQRHKRNRWTDVTICPELFSELLRWLDQYAVECGYVPGYFPAEFLMREHPDWYLIPRLAVTRTPGPYTPESHTYSLRPDTPTRRLETVVKGVLDDLRAADTRNSEHPKGRNHLGEGMHTIRRSGARAMLDNLSEGLGHDRALLQVAIMLDHDDPQVTLLYIGVNIERDKLNEFLKTNSMYATGPAKPYLREVV